VGVEAEGSGGRAVRLNLVKPGEIVGEIAALRGCDRSATVRALESCELLAIPQSEFLALLVGHPALAIQTLGSVIERLRTLSEAVGAANA
jgi:CRP-like cAMP-binding protein